MVGQVCQHSVDWPDSSHFFLLVDSNPHFARERCRLSEPALPVRAQRGALWTTFFWLSRRFLCWSATTLCKSILPSPLKLKPCHPHTSSFDSFNTSCPTILRAPPFLIKPSRFKPKALALDQWWRAMDFPFCDKNFCKRDDVYASRHATVRYYTTQCCAMGMDSLNIACGGGKD